MLDIILILISLPALVLACALWAAVGYGSARRLGYRPIGAAMVMIAGGASGVVATIVRHPPNSTGFQFLVDFFWLTWLSAVVVTAIILLVLPRRQLRTFGNRRPGFPFARIGQLFVVAGLLLSTVVIAWSVRRSMDSAQAVAGLALAAGFLLPTGRYLQRLGRRADAEATSDQYGVERLEHPVLYLRAFRQEGQFFTIRAASEYGTLPRSWHAAVSKPDQNVGRTFEEYFADALKGSIGPFVALGSPEDYMAPEGAARLYAKDTDWMEHVNVLARNAAAIVVEVGASANLRWEFEYIRQEGLHQKLFVITPALDGREMAVVGVLEARLEDAGLAGRFIPRVRGQPRAAWLRPRRRGRRPRIGHRVRHGRQGTAADHARCLARRVRLANARLDRRAAAHGPLRAGVLQPVRPARVRISGGYAEGERVSRLPVRQADRTGLETHRIARLRPDLDRRHRGHLRDRGYLAASQRFFLRAAHRRRADGSDRRVVRHSDVRAGPDGGPASARRT